MAKSKTSGIARKMRVPKPETQELRKHYIEVAAYYIAEQRGFETGGADNDWAQAELEIDRMFDEMRLEQ